MDWARHVATDLERPHRTLDTQQYDRQQEVLGRKNTSPIPEEEGLTASVIPRSVWEAYIPPTEHWPFAFVDIFTGTSYTDPSSAIGLAQKLGDVTFNDVQVGDDFRRLDDIVGIQVRLSIQTGTGGQCTVTLQNPLEERSRPGGGTFWERKFFKRGRFFDGARIQYMSKYRGSEGNIWFPAVLKQVGNDAGVVVLDGIDYAVDWGKTVAQGSYEATSADRPDEAADGTLQSDYFFSEEMGEPIFAPMQKVKIYAANRFPPEVLKKFGYRNIRGDVPHMSLPDREIPLSELIEFQGNLTDSDGNPVASAAYMYSTNIFTGYVSNVSTNQAGGRWTIDFTARDVTCWLDYSMLNVNPSLDIFGRDIRAEAEVQNWLIFTTRFEGMPAHEIIRAIFLGLKEARTRSNTFIYNSYGGSTSIIGPNKEPLVLPPGSRVYIHDIYYGSNVDPSLEPLRYKVATNIGYEGWINADDLQQIAQSYLGIGSFLIDDDPSELVSAVSKDMNEVIEAFANDKLIIYPIQEPEDQYVVKAYRTFFRQNWPLIQSEYASRRSIVNTVCKHSNSELYADGGGRVWFHPVRAYASVRDPIYVIQPEETTSWEIAISDRELITWAHVHGQFDFNIIPGEWIYANEFTSVDMVKRFGVRAVHLSNPNVTTAEGAMAYAKAMLRRINANMVTARIGIILRPELQLARNVFIPWLNLIGYIATIDHNIQWGKVATTTISLKYIRHPWDPWFPLAYKAKEDLDMLQNAPRYTKPGWRDAGASARREVPIRYSRAIEGKWGELAPNDPLLSEDTIAGQKKLKRDMMWAYTRAEGYIAKYLSKYTNVKLRIARTTENITHRGDLYRNPEVFREGWTMDIEIQGLERVNSLTPGSITINGSKFKNYNQVFADIISPALHAFQAQKFNVYNMYDHARNTELSKGFGGFLQLKFIGSRIGSINDLHP